MSNFVLRDNVELLKNKAYIYNDLISHYHNPENQRIRKEEDCYNFEIVDLYNELFVDFYMAVKRMCENSFESFKNPKPYGSMMAYVSNKDFFDSRNHRHCEFNDELIAVYYLSVPEGEGGEIGFYKTEDESTQVGIIKPKENDILVFPATAFHKPFKLDSEKYRISLNISINANFKYK